MLCFLIVDGKEWQFSLKNMYKMIILLFKLKGKVNKTYYQMLYMDLTLTYETRASEWETPFQTRFPVIANGAEQDKWPQAES